MYFLRLEVGNENDSIVRQLEYFYRYIEDEHSVSLHPLK